MAHTSNQNTSAASPQNETDYLNTGQHFEEQDNFEKAFEIYNQGLNQFPEEKEFHRRLALLYLNKAKKDEALEHFSKYIEDNNNVDTDTAFIFGGLVEEVHGTQKALELYKQINTKLNHHEIDNLIQQLEKNKEPGIDAEYEPGEITASADTISNLFSYFSGQENNYAIQWVKDDNTGYSPANEPLSFQTAARHLKGEITVGIYQLNTASQVKWCAFDVDIKKQLVDQRGDEGRNINFLLYQALTAAKELQNVLTSRGLKSYIEFSGNKGYHVWIFLEDFISAQNAKEIMTHVLNQADFGVLDQIISIEIFPKQIQLSGKKKLGNLIKLPFGIHKKNGKRSYFLDDNDKPLKQPSDFFHLAEKNSIQQLKKCTEMQAIETEGTDPPDTLNMVKDSSLTSVMSSDPDFNLLIARCRILDFIVNKIVWEKECTDDEFTIVKHTVGHLRNGKQLVNDLLLNLKTTNENLKLKKNLTGYPMGCKKIKQRVPDLSMRFNCNCNFSTDLKEYKHPLLHIKEFHLDREQLSKRKVDALKFQKHLEKYLETKKEIKESVERVKSIEKYLNNYLDEKNVEELKTEFGVLKRITHPNGDSTLMMEL